MKYYRHNYIIGIYKKYQNDDSLVALCDNLSEFAEFMEISKYNAAVILSKAWNKEIEFIRWNGCICEICFLNINDIL